MALGSIPKDHTIIVYLGGLNTVGYKLLPFIHYFSLSLSLSPPAVEENLCMWDEMKAGSERGQQCCLRAKMDMQPEKRSHHPSLQAPTYVYQGQIQVRDIIHVCISDMRCGLGGAYKYMAWVRG